MGDKLKIDKEKKVNLDDYDPGDANGADKDYCVTELAALSKELGELQEWLYAAQKQSVLIVLQGMDTSGKDGTIAHVMANVNTQACDVTTFKVPTVQELAYDFLWRVHQHTPPKGKIMIFNRSHYEDVLVTRVHKIISKDVCEQRYRHIRNFEELLADNNTIILKFFLHISKQEQEDRLLAREQDEEKAWKLSVGDWEERKYWKDYQKAYEDAIGATATKVAPWYIIPANHKWYRNLAIARILVESLRGYKDDWKEALKEVGEERKAELAKMRAGSSQKKNGKS